MVLGGEGGSEIRDALLNFWQNSKEKTRHMGGGGGLKKSIYTMTLFVDDPLMGEFSKKTNNDGIFVGTLGYFEMVYY
jgi:hypothetical protein